MYSIDNFQKDESLITLYTHDAMMHPPASCDVHATNPSEFQPCPRSSSSAHPESNTNVLAVLLEVRAAVLLAAFAMVPSTCGRSSSDGGGTDP